MTNQVSMINIDPQQRRSEDGMVTNEDHPVSDGMTGHRIPSTQGKTHLTVDWKCRTRKWGTTFIFNLNLRLRLPESKNSTNAHNRTTQLLYNCIYLCTQNSWTKNVGYSTKSRHVSLDKILALAEFALSERSCLYILIIIIIIIIIPPGVKNNNNNNNNNNQCIYNAPHW